MSDEMCFDDLEPVIIKVSIGKQPYTLREANAGAARKWQNAIFRATKVGKDGSPNGIGDLADCEVVLLSECLFDDKGKKVPQAVILSWPARVVSVLYEKVKEISDLNPKSSPENATEDEEKAKNEQEAMTDISA
jgi:hypothetical protein